MAKQNYGGGCEKKKILNGVETSAKRKNKRKHEREEPTLGRGRQDEMEKVKDN